MKAPAFLSYLFIFVGFSLFAPLSFYILSSVVDDTPIVADGMENLKIAHNIAVHNTFSSTADLVPEMKREPMWPLFIAGILSVADLNQKSVKEISTKHAAYLKRINILIYVAVSVLATFWICLHTKRRLLALAGCMMISLISILTTPRLINKLNNEPLACLLLIVASLLFYRAVRKGGVGPFWAGLCLGLLTLTKAQFLYISIFPIAWLYWKSWRKGFMALLAMSIVVLPWLARNYHLFEEISISERGQTVLAIRFILTAKPHLAERKCMIYAFSHPQIRTSLHNVLHIDDTDFLRDGECERLNRELCFDMGVEKVKCSPFKEDRAKGQWDSKIQYFFQGFSAGKAIEANQMEFKDISAFDLQLLETYISTLPLFMWRGLGFTKYPLLSVAMVAALFLLAFSKCWPIAVIPISSHLFHVMLTHNLPRYHAVEFGVLFIALTYFLLRMFDYISAKWVIFSKRNYSSNPRPTPSELYVDEAGSETDRPPFS